MNRDVLSVVGNTIWKEEDRFEIQNQEDFSFREYLWFWCLCFVLGMDILTSYVHIIYGKWNKISGFGRILNG